MFTPTNTARVVHICVHLAIDIGCFNLFLSNYYSFFLNELLDI